ncbi:hypothetical protein JOF41_004983 [Saccharothrix coeruleofusca]|uniref:hypothetical protein n=1 Tax=Saccharothrix coeruleofusca TaxID=33919 RepID=UPI001AE9B8B4|nr:hypothetical protein [Saccharothrix coeruleofusca]MBP2338805.1 hypothetical protein [Saccharothrix coeruleofusca]
MRRRKRGSGRAAATLCIRCGALGWEDKRHAMGEAHRIRQRSQLLAAGGPAARGHGVHRCDAELWHLTVPTARPAVEPVELWLPQPPRRPPHLDAPDRQSYLEEVMAVVLHAIREQGAGLAMPALTTICDHYGTGRSWTWRLRRALAELGWLHRSGHLYLTSVPEPPRPPAQD